MSKKRVVVSSSSRRLAKVCVCVCAPEASHTHHRFYDDETNDDDSNYDGRTKRDTHVDSNLDFRKAAMRAAAIIQSNSVLFKDAVQSEATRLAKSQFMKQLNTTREIIKDESFEKGFEEGYNAAYEEFEERDQFHVPCSICNEPIKFSDHDPNWEQKKQYLHVTFKERSY